MHLIDGEFYCNRVDNSLPYCSAGVCVKCSNDAAGDIFCFNRDNSKSKCIAELCINLCSENMGKYLFF